MTVTRCWAKGCDSLVDPAPMDSTVSAYCRVHGLWRLVTWSRRGLPVHDPHITVDASPYMRWLVDLEDSQTLEYDGHTLTHVTQRTAAVLTGCTPTTLSNIAHGHRPRIKPATAKKLDPWVLRTSVVGTAESRVREVIGDGLVTSPRVADRLPVGTVVVDRRGVSWQRWGDRFRPPVTTAVTSKWPTYPVRVLWVPPA